MCFTIVPFFNLSCVCLERPYNGHKNPITNSLKGTFFSPHKREVKNESETKALIRWVSITIDGDGMEFQAAPLADKGTVEGFSVGMVMTM